MADATINLDLQRLIRLLPGYDPFRDAGDCVFDEAAARLVIEFIEECCTFTQGEKAGEPFLLEDWQKAFVANLFGWKRPDGTRRYRKALLYIARGNGKSELAAAINCVILYLDDEPGAQIYSAAAKRDQTRFVFDPTCKMIRACPEMAERAEIYKGAIVVGDKSYKTISREATTEHGGNTHFADVDELHAQPDRDLVDVLQTSMVKRRQPLLLYMTTADFERPSICNEIHDYASKVRDGIIPDGEFLPAIFEAGRDDDWTDPETWRKANPNMGVSITEEALASLCRDAQQRPSFENTFKRLHLDLRTEQASRWLPMEKWDACTEVTEPVAWRKQALEALRGKTCTGALDLGSTSDLTAFVLLFEHPTKKGGYLALPFFWVPMASARRREERDRVPYLQWIKQGFITPTEGVFEEVTDFAFVRRDINDLASRYSLPKSPDTGRPEVALDRLFQGDQMASDLTADGFDVVAFGQGFLSMAAPSKKLEELVVAGLLEHGANPVLRWMASNAAADEDAAGNIKPSKKSSSEKIDGIVALLMALGRAMAYRSAGGSFYEEHKVRHL